MAKAVAALSLVACCVAGSGAVANVDWHTVRVAASSDIEYLEYIYLHELSAASLAALHRHALVGGVVVQPEFNRLARFSKCSLLLPSLLDIDTQLRHEVAQQPVNPEARFERLLVLSLLLTQINRELHVLGVERTKIQKNFMENVVHHADSQAKLTELDEKIAVLRTNMDTIFSADTANMLLTVMVTDPATGTRQHLYQKIARDYQQLLNEGALGGGLITTLQQQNTVFLQQAAQQAMQRSMKLMQRAWRHTCSGGLLALPRVRVSKRFLFYAKHHALVEHVETLLADIATPELAALHAKLKESLTPKVTPQHYRTSPRSFFGLLGALVAPSFLVARQYNKITLPLMATAGLTVTWHKTKALHAVREQLQTGVFSGLNRYAQYLDFKSNTSISKYAFSHAAATALALVLRKIPRPADGKLLNVDTKLLAKVNALASLVSMFAVEAWQTREFNFLKERDFFYNMFTLLVLDYMLGYISALSISDEVRIALISASTMLVSVTGHVVSGKEINWDRIVYDTTFISTISLYKSTYFYTKGSRALINNFNISTRNGQTAIMSGMALLSNSLGNIPYSIISRLWVEKKPPANVFSLQDVPPELQFDNVEQISAYLQQRRDLVHSMCRECRIALPSQ